ncbi:MAG: NMD3-related protein [archaeon]
MSSLTNPFCSVCGNAGTFPGNICPECREKDSTPLPFHKEKEEKIVRFCKSCKRVKLKKRWALVNRENLPTHYKFTKSLCPDCYKESREYYSTILRFQEEGFSPEREKLINRTVASVLEEENGRGKKTALTKVDGGGRDFYFTHISTARLAAKKLAKAARVQVRADAHLFGYDASAGKGKFKVSILVKFLE